MNINKLNSKLLFTSYIGYAFVFCYIYFLYTWEYEPGSMARVANFEAVKVFQPRLLLVLSAKYLNSFFPLSNEFISAFRLPVSSGLEFYIFGFVFLGTVALLLGFSNLLEILHNTSMKPIELWLSFGILGIPLFWNYAFINNLFYPYDIPSMAFFVWGIILFYKRKYYLFYFLFILATLNRESSCFISIAVFVLLFRISETKNIISKNRQLYSHIIIQLIIWLGIRYSLRYLFKDNPGFFMEETHSFIDFLKLALTNQNHWAFGGTPGDSASWFFTTFAGIWLIVVLRWNRINEVVKKLVIVGAIYLCGCIARANLMEIRVYNELLVMISILACSAIISRKQETM